MNRFKGDHLITKINLQEIGWKNIQLMGNYIIADGSMFNMLLHIGIPDDIEGFINKGKDLYREPWYIEIVGDNVKWTDLTKVENMKEKKKTIFESPSICGHGHDLPSDCLKCTPDRDDPKPVVLTKWDKRFMEQAKTYAQYSKDKNTKTGAVVVDYENTEIVMGYNGFPRGADDDTDQRRYERPLKYMWTEHAERNAIYKAARLGVSVKGTKMYCTYFPCVDCARAIIQAGIIAVYTEKPDLNHEKWGESWIEAIIMFKECGVEIIWTNNTRWLAQHILAENLWYVTEHGDEGIVTELFFDTEKECYDHIEKNKLVVKWEN